jgi:hypothetical protein
MKSKTAHHSERQTPLRTIMVEFGYRRSRLRHLTSPNARINYSPGRRTRGPAKNSKDQVDDLRVPAWNHIGDRELFLSSAVKR